MSRTLSGSALGIAVECGWAYHKDSAYPEAPRDDAAKDGTTFHDGINARLTPGAALPMMRPELAAKARAAVAWLESEGIAVVASERSYAYRPSDRSVRVLGDNINREYEAHGLDVNNEIPFTVDLVGRRRDGTYVVVDWKNDALQGFLEPAGDSLQLGMAAYAVAQSMLARQVDAVYAFVGADEVRSDVGSHNGFSLLRILGRAEQAWTNTKRKSEPVDGSHCRYCPALGACPKTKANLSELSETLPEGKGITWTTEYISDENDAKMVLSLTAMEKAVENIRDALKERARAKGGLALPNGKVWQLSVRSRSSFDKAKAEELLGDRFAECVRSIEYETFVQKKVK